MKKIILMVMFILIPIISNAQYVEDISSYNLYWRLLDKNQSLPVPGHVFKSDTSVVLNWERGDGTIPPYQSPYSGVYESAQVIVNTPQLWNGTNTAQVSKNVVLQNGLYELTITESDIYENESGHSEPLLISIEKMVARVQVNLSISP